MSAGAVDVLAGLIDAVERYVETCDAFDAAYGPDEEEASRDKKEAREQLNAAIAAAEARRHV